MPNCFTLTRISDYEAGPVKLTNVDEEMCTHFDTPCHPDQWHHGWYDSIGLGLACGKSFDQLITFAHESLEITPANDTEGVRGWQHQLEIIRWLKNNFTADAFYRNK